MPVVLVVLPRSLFPFGALDPCNTVVQPRRQLLKLATQVPQRLAHAPGQASRGALLLAGVGAFAWLVWPEATRFLIWRRQRRAEVARARLERAMSRADREVATAERARERADRRPSSPRRAWRA